MTATDSEIIDRIEALEARVAGIENSMSWVACNENETSPTEVEVGKNERETRMNETD